MSGPLVADSQLIWVVGFLLVASFLALAAIPYLAARRRGRRAAFSLAAAWAVLGVGLMWAFADLDRADAVVAGLLVFGVPWSIAALAGTHGRARDGSDDHRALS